MRLSPNSPAIEKLEKAKFIASLYKFDYKPSYKLEEEEIVNRVLKLLYQNNIQRPPDKHFESVLGMVTTSDMNLKPLVKQYYMITRHELSGKNEKQIERWKHSHNRPVDVLNSLIGNLQLVNLNQSHGLILRDHLFERIKTKEMVATTANRQFHCLTKMLKTVNKHLQLNINTEIFKGFIFKDQRITTRPSLSIEWLRNHLIKASPNINEESLAVIRIMANTGCRLNEACGLAEDDIKLDAAVPHIKICPNKHRQIKNKPSIRDVPLVGVALEGAKKLQALGETNRRYIAKNDSLSAQINKYFKSNNLWEKQGQSIYCMRHSFQDRLITKNIPERIQCELMGHALYKPRYGAGTDLEQKQEAIKTVAIEGG